MRTIRVCITCVLYCFLYGWAFQAFFDSSNLSPVSAAKQNKSTPATNLQSENQQVTGARTRPRGLRVQLEVGFTRR